MTDHIGLQILYCVWFGVLLFLGIMFHPVIAILWAFGSFGVYIIAGDN